MKTFKQLREELNQLDEISKLLALKTFGRQVADQAKTRFAHIGSELAHPMTPDPQAVPRAWRAAKRNYGTGNSLLRVAGAKPGTQKRLNQWSEKKMSNILPGQTVKDTNAKKWANRYGVDDYKKVLNYKKPPMTEAKRPQHRYFMSPKLVRNHPRLAGVAAGALTGATVGGLQDTISGGTTLGIGTALGGLTGAAAGAVLGKKMAEY